MQIEFYGTITEFYTYRTAMVHPQIVINNVDWREVKEYVEENGYKMDNHIAFKTSDGFYIGYSDHNLYISTNIDKRNW